MGIKAIVPKKGDDGWLDDRKNIEEVIKEIDSRTKIIELDFERRLVMLEKEISIIRELMGKIKDEKSLKMLLSNAQEIREKLRDLEDLKYVEHLEVINTIEKVEHLYAEYDVLSKKINIIEEALKKIPELNTFALEFKDRYEELKHKLHNIENEIMQIEEGYAKIEDVVKIKDVMEKINAEVEKALRDMAEMSRRYKENVEANEKLAKLIEEKYQELESKTSKYDAYEEQITNIKTKLDEVAKILLEDKKRSAEKILIKVEYLLKRYDKAFGLLQREIDALKEMSSQQTIASSENISGEVKKHVEEIKKLKDEINTMLGSISKLTPKKVEQLKKILTTKSKKIAEYEKEIENINARISDLEIKVNALKKNVDLLKEKMKNNSYVDHAFFESKLKELEDEINTKLKNIEDKQHTQNIDVGDITGEVNKKFLDISKNLAKLLDERIKQMRKDMYKTLKKTVKQEIDSNLSNELLEMFKNEVWQETLGIITTHEMKEEQKIEILKEFESYLSSEIDKLRSELIELIRLEKSHEDLPNTEIKGELIDTKKKLYMLIEEQSKKIKELEEKIARLMEESKHTPTPYIIE